MGNQFLYTVTDILPHAKGFLLLPGISQDRVSSGDFNVLRPGTELLLMHQDGRRSVASVATFAVPWDMKDLPPADAIMAPIALVIECADEVSIGTRIWVAESVK